MYVQVGILALVGDHSTVPLTQIFFSAAPTAQNSPELHFRFIHSFIQPSLVGSIVINQGLF